MTTSVRALPAGALTATAAEFLRDNGFSAAPVIDEDDKLVGVVTRSALASTSGGPPPPRPVTWLVARHGL